jgi:hypothetical protein
MKKILLFLGCIFLIHHVAYSQAGETGLSFLKLGVGGRALGMGEAYSAVAADPNAMFYNPAAMSQADDAQILLMHKEWIQGVKTDYLGALTTWKAFRFGLSVNSTSVDDIELRSVPGPALGTFDARNAAIGLSLSYMITSSLSVGMTAKYLYEKILINEASGTGIDLGATYRTEWNILLAAGISNLGSMNPLADEASTLPRIFRAGGAYAIPLQDMDGTLTVASDVVSITNDNITHVNVGAELEYHRTFALRAGYQTGYDTKNFSAGIGIYYNLLKFDYAYVPFTEDFGTTHTFSLGIEFQ